MMGRFVLPLFGGGPAVWTGCLLFFQTLLLGGYAYAHALGRFGGARVHIALLVISLAFLPIGPGASLWQPRAGGDPSFQLLWILAAGAGVPYFLLSSTGPLVQRWFTLSEPGASPWRLYALSNAGSLIALLTYPFAIETWLRLKVQAWIWSALYAVFVVMCAFTAWRVRDAAPEAGRPAWQDVLFWIGLSACASTLLMASTNQICQEIAVNPFLWVAPLSIYLLTFILAFEREGFYRRPVFAVAAGIFAMIGCAAQGAAIALSIAVQLGLYLAVLFFACMICQGELARSRPAPRYLTWFYLCIAAGGALGGVFVALVAPRVFTEFSEYPIGLGAACGLGIIGWIRDGALAQWSTRRATVRVPLLALMAGAATAAVAAFNASDPSALISKRNFYGILRVTERSDANGPRRALRHGRVLHGFQYLDADKRAWQTTYYGPHSGAALILNSLDRPNRRVALVGLGVGTMSAWGRGGDTFRFYEINPDVETIARTYFTYLKDSPARTQVILGDARVQLEREAPGNYDLIIVDAFSSDAIPVHLLTTECADLYRRHLAPGGLLMFHISNRILDLDPVVRGLAAHLGWSATRFTSEQDDRTGELRAEWMLVSPPVKATPTPPNVITWTDDFTSLWHVLRF